MGGLCMKEPVVVVAEPTCINSNLQIKTNNSHSNFNEDDEEEEDNQAQKLNLNKYLFSERGSADLKLSPFLSPQYYNTNILEFIKGECIGTGRLGCVYSGLSVNTGEIVAIKSVKLNRTTSLQKQVFEINEAVEKLGGLKHKNIIKYMCTQRSEHEDEIDIIFEYCNGGSIKQLLEKFGSFDEKLIKLYVKQTLEGLIYLHDQNIVHRNIKNCNVLVDGNGTVKLSDFIVSNILIGDDPRAILYFNTNKAQDPPFWMAPEIVNKEKNLTPAVDIWSLGCIIIEMATRNPPWSNVTTNCQEVIELIGNTNAPPKFPGHVSKDLKSFLNCCLQKSPQRRLSARKLLDHNLFNINLLTQVSIKKLESGIFYLNDEIARDKDKEKDKNRDLKNPEIIKIIPEPKLNPKKLLKNANFHIIEKKSKEIDKDKDDLELNKNVINMLANNDGTGNAFFSLSMTVYSQQSIIPNFNDLFYNKDNKILPPDIEEVEEDENYYSPGRKCEVGNKFENEDNFKFNLIQMNNGYDGKDNTDNNKEEEYKYQFINNKKTEEPNQNYVSQSSNSIKNFIDNYNINVKDLNDTHTGEKLGTLEIKKDDINKLEAYFKGRNVNTGNLMSIGPIEIAEA